MKSNASINLSFYLRFIGFANKAKAKCSYFITLYITLEINQICSIYFLSHWSQLQRLMQEGHSVLRERINSAVLSSDKRSRSAPDLNLLIDFKGCVLLRQTHCKRTADTSGVKEGWVMLRMNRCILTYAWLQFFRSHSDLSASYWQSCKLVYNLSGS